MASSNGTGFRDDAHRQNQVDSIVAHIERQLLRVPETTDESSPCGIQNVQVVQNCGNYFTNDFDKPKSCQETFWISFDNETETSSNNQTLLVYDDDTDSWYNLSSYSLRIRYHNGGSYFNESSSEIGFCKADVIDSCPFVNLDESQFSPVADTDHENHTEGSLVFTDTGQILSPDEYVRTGDGHVKVCSNILIENKNIFNFNKAQVILSTVGISISVLAGSLTAITYAVFHGLHGRTRKAIMGMVLSLIAAQILLLMSGIATADKKACIVVAVASHYLWMTSMTWTNVLAFLLFHTFSTKNPGPSKVQVAFTSKVNLLSIAYALGVPLAIVTPCLVINFCSCTNIELIYAEDRVCWISPGLINLIAFGLPMAMFLVINIVLFARTVWAIWSSRRRSQAQFKKGRDKSTLRQRRKELMIYTRIASLMGFTWIFGFLSNAFPDAEALPYLFILLNSLQGLFIFLSFTFNNQVKQMWQKKLSSGRASVFTKTSFLTKASKSSSAVSSVSAGIAASESMEMSSLSTSDRDECLKGTTKSAAGLKATLRKFWARSRYSPEGPKSNTEDSNCLASTVHEEVRDNEYISTKKPAGLRANLSKIWLRGPLSARRDPKSKTEEYKSHEDRDNYPDGSVECVVSTVGGVPVDECNNTTTTNNTSGMKTALANILAKGLPPSRPPLKSTNVEHTDYDGLQGQGIPARENHRPWAKPLLPPKTTQIPNIGDEETRCDSTSENSSIPSTIQAKDANQNTKKWDNEVVYVVVNPTPPPRPTVAYQNGEENDKISAGDADGENSSPDIAPLPQVSPTAKKPPPRPLNLLKHKGAPSQMSRVEDLEQISSGIPSDQPRSISEKKVFQEAQDGVPRSKPLPPLPPSKPKSLESFSSADSDKDLCTSISTMPEKASDCRSGRKPAPLPRTNLKVNNGESEETSESVPAVAGGPTFTSSSEDRFTPQKGVDSEVHGHLSSTKPLPALPRSMPKANDVAMGSQSRNKPHLPPRPKPRDRDSETAVVGSSSVGSFECLKSTPSDEADEGRDSEAPTSLLDNIYQFIDQEN